MFGNRFVIVSLKKAILLVTAKGKRFPAASNTKYNLSSECVGIW